MAESLTLIIPTHNRHRYLCRALTYYEGIQIPVYVLDSTLEPYQGSVGSGVTYFHLAGYSLTQKLDFISTRILTSFVVMCADDDFIIPESIYTCASFLKNNSSFSSVMGNSIYYTKESARADRIEFTTIYTDRLSFEVKDDDPFKRIQQFFSNYRTIFYAVHKTESFVLTFKGVGNVVRNLFLNEYLTSVVPLLAGRIAELPILYHIREYAMDSDDKTTVNLDAIFEDPAYRKEYEGLLLFCSRIACVLTGKDESTCKRILDDILSGHARRLPAMRNYVNTGGVKRVGNVIGRIPVIGKVVIIAFRRYQRKKALKFFIKSALEERQLAIIQQTIEQYKHVI